MLPTAITTPHPGEDGVGAGRSVQTIPAPAQGMVLSPLVLSKLTTMMPSWVPAAAGVKVTVTGCDLFAPTEPPAQLPVQASG